jgi:hypothetical protein
MVLNNCKPERRVAMTVKRVSMKTRLVQKTKLMGIFKHRVFLMAACLPITLAVAACNQLSAAPRAAVPTPTTIERGKMLVIGGACHDCQTAKKLGPHRPAGGRATDVMGFVEAGHVAAL